MSELPAEPTEEELANAQWFKATEGDSAKGCVEVAHLASWIALRDSKNLERVQLYTPFEWECFLDGVSKGEFNRA